MDLQDLVRINPAERQIAWQKLEFTAFLHFGMNTFTNREWGDGQEDPSWYYPTHTSSSVTFLAALRAALALVVFLVTGIISSILYCTL